MLLNLSEGNKKLAKSENKRFLIWNLPAVTTCPNRTELCEKYCYARKAERLYPQVLPSRSTNYEESLKLEFVSNMIETIESYLSRKSWKNDKVYFRIHESGDFYNKEYFWKWLRIAEYFHHSSEYAEKIVFMAYTKSFEQIEQLYQSKTSNFIIRASIWNDTKNTDLELIERLELPTYSAYKNMEELETSGRLYCHCDCSKCKLCYTQAYNIGIIIH